jgi:hypothetical protein
VTSPSLPGSTLEAAWREQSVWSQAADRAKREYMWWSRAALVMTLCAALFATAAGQLAAADELRRVFSFLAAAFVAALAVIGGRFTSPERMRGWIRARSASEGLKSEIYLFLTRTDRYAAADTDAQFSSRVDAIRQAVKDLLGNIADITPKSDAVPRDPMPVQEYVQTRVDAQILKYYRPKAASEARLVRRYRTAEFVLALTAALLGALGGIMDQAAITPWSAVVTTAIAALAARLAAGRHEYQVTTYTATALELERLSTQFKDLARSGRLEAREVDDIVKQCEAVISVENQGWMAQWEQPAKG